MFLSASNFNNLNNSWAYNLECTKEFECEDGRNVNNKIAWPLFFIVVLIFLSTDLYDSLMMFRQGILQRNFRKVIAGFILLFISVLSFVTSFLYNNAAAMTTIDILIDAAVILFLSNLDECIHELISHMAPDWEEDIEKSICPEDNNDIGESVNDGVVKISEFNKLKKEFKEMKQQVDVLTATLKSHLPAMQKELNMKGNETLGEEEKVEIERESVMQNIDHVRKDDDASIDSTSSADNISSSNDSDDNIKLKKKSRRSRKYKKRRKS